ncbi:MAG: hypothetical protein B6D63_04995 [Candidatus Latescibacteria bacterium 4484_7]|nr:MAG: hypothetical protein B6D63_04995 [Candidatus Latescibacteria bacterium 4484_7]
MKKLNLSGNDFSIIVKRALEGKISPVSFVLVLGFFASTLLLYISLHVYFLDLSQRIEADRLKANRLMNEKLYLSSEYDRLTSPEKIIPVAVSYGLKPAGPENIKRVAFSRKNSSRRRAPRRLDSEIRFVQAGVISIRDER